MMAEFSFGLATREQVVLKIALSGPSGSGKTLSALLLARGLLPPDAPWSDIGVADTENNSSKYYVGASFMAGEPPQAVTVGQFSHTRFDPPFRPERWIAVINDAVKSGIRVLVLDTISDEWVGEDGTLDWNRKLGGRGDNWAVTGPAHARVMTAIRMAPIPIICCLREEQKHEIVRTVNDKGKDTYAVHKLGLRPQQRDGTDYLFDVMLTLEHATHYARVGAGKDRTGLFSAHVPAPISPETGRVLQNWAASGEDPVGSRGWVVKRCEALRTVSCNGSGVVCSRTKCPACAKALVDLFTTTAAQGASLLIEDYKALLRTAKDEAKRRLGLADAGAGQ